MNLDAKIKTIFEDVVKSKTDKVKKDSSEFELKQLESQLNKHLQDKQGQKFKKVSVFNFNEKNDYNESTFGDLINKEIEDKYVNKNWKTLPLYLKWKIVQDYFLENNIIDKKIIKSVKDAINNNKINDFISFDNITQKVTNIDLIAIK
jgi:hypothetical protein